MRDWYKTASDIDRDCIHWWERLFRIQFKSYEEYSKVDALIDEMILEYENKKELKQFYPNINADVKKFLGR